MIEVLEQNLDQRGGETKLLERGRNIGVVILERESVPVALFATGVLYVSSDGPDMAEWLSVYSSHLDWVRASLGLFR